MNTCWKSFVYFPIAFLILMPGGFFICYGIAVSADHVVSIPDWPYVSDTGAYPPESCIFTLFLTWGAFAILTTMVLYYRYVIYHGYSSKCNIAALIIGCFASFGVTLVGAFQWTNVLVPHLIGAFLAFVGAVIYSWIIVYISWKHLSRRVHGKSIVYFRILLAILETVSILVLIVGLALLRANEKIRNLATISEWCLIYFALLFLFTMVYDLRNIKRAELHITLHGLTESTPLQSMQLQKVP